jgi:hypothetical protein
VRTLRYSDDSDDSGWDWWDVWAGVVIGILLGLCVLAIIVLASW